MKSMILKPVSLLLLQIGLILSLAGPILASGQETGMSALNISMALINQRDGSSKILPPGSIELASQKVTFKEGDKLEKLLASQGIFADGESVGIVYLLNPGLDAKSMKAGAEIILPFVKDKKQFSGEFDKGSLVALTLDKDQKQEFLKVLRELEASTTSLMGLSAKQFESPEEKSKFIKTTKSIVDKMGGFKIVIKERTRPLNSEMLQQMNSEAKQMNSILDNIIKHNQNVSKNDLETAELISRDMDIRMQSLAEQKGVGGLPPRWPDVLVTVKTINVQQGKEIPNLRVYYVPQALWNYRNGIEKSFDRLTSPADKALPEADYYIWAAKPGDSTPITERKALEVRKPTGKERIELDLAVK
jgi:K+/H+ antiporter YhaU regulatory subunit KhtT